MIRRPLWLAAGVALGAGGTLWTRRRLEGLSRRIESGTVGADLASLADRSAHAAAHRVRAAVDAGRKAARRREDDLRRELEDRAFHPNGRVAR
ncbi:MAG TPA: hypothetical protein VKU86_06420 [Acidimicrobiales bacterium]|nr:hypothetical protein [Acidimicrobiales bacterium]